MRIGDVVGGRFALEELAGAGGMGQIFRATDQSSGETVAVKVLLEDRNPERSRRFEREARVLSELRHPGIVRYIAHGETRSGERYLAMEWLDGEDLSNFLRRSGLTLAEALCLVTRVADALGAAHARRIVHRDLKPSNLFLVRGRPEQVKVIDFGIAQLDGMTQLTGTGTAIGTPGYMAPEQARGDEALDARADVFSLGCVLFECVTGQNAFSAVHLMALLAKILFEEVPRMSELRPAVPPSLDALAASMLSKQPSMRPRDGAAVAAALAAIEVEPIPGAEAAPLLNASAGRVALTESERRLLCVVLISRGASLGLSTTHTAGATDVIPITAEMRRLIAAYGGRLEVLVDGSAVGTIVGATQSATDQVTRAARCALALSALVPDRSVVLSTVRTEVTGRLPVGAAADQAAKLLAGRSAGGGGKPAIGIDEVTAGLLDARFDVERGGAGLYLLRGERDAAPEVRTLLGKPTPCVGRDRDLATLEGFWVDCNEEMRAQAVLVTAPAGMGKSRLAYELLHRIRKREVDVAIWMGRGDSLRAGSAFGLLVQALRGALGISDGEPLEIRRQKLRARVAERVTPGEQEHAVEFLGELVGTPFSEEESPKLRAARKDAQLMGDQMRRAFIEFLRAEASARPVLLVLEDLHWGDLPTVRYVDAALRELRDHPWMVLSLARPEVHDSFPKLWAERGIQEMRLQQLSRKASERLVRQVLGDRVTSETVARLVNQADGHAFYLEELIRAAAEGKGAALPETVLAMVQARVEGLEPDARRVLRAASIFGEVCWEGGILALLGGEHPSRARSAGPILWMLAEREVLVHNPESRFPGETEFTFRHALLREGAYAMLTDEDQVLGHRLAGEWLTQRGESNALALAEHFERGAAAPRAIDYYVQAAEQAFEANAMEAALSCAERGLGCGAQGEQRGALLSLQAGVCLGREEHARTIALGTEALDLLPAGGRRWCRTFQYVFPAMFFSRPEALSQLIPRFMSVDPSADALGENIRAATWLSVVLNITGRNDAAQVLRERTRRVIDGVDRRDVGTWAYFEAAEANHHLVAEDAPWRCMLAHKQSQRGMRDAGIRRLECIIASYHGKALADLGDHAGAADVLRRNLALAEQLNEALPLAYARLNLVRALADSVLPDGFDEVIRLAQEVIATNNAALTGLGYGVLAVIKRRQGDLTGAEADARTACEWLRRFPAQSWANTASLVWTLLEQGRVSEASQVGDGALRELERLRITSHGEIALRLAVAEARHAAGEIEAAHDMLRTTIERLRIRVGDIPETAARQRYLTDVPTHARLRALAQAWLGEGAPSLE